MSWFQCGRVDFRIHMSTWRVAQNSSIKLSDWELYILNLQPLWISFPSQFGKFICFQEKSNAISPWITKLSNVYTEIYQFPFLVCWELHTSQNWRIIHFICIPIENQRTKSSSGTRGPWPQVLRPQNWTFLSPVLFFCIFWPHFAQHSIPFIIQIQKFSILALLGIPFLT